MSRAFAEDRLSFDRDESGTLRLRLSGAWKIDGRLPGVSEARSRIETDPRPGKVAFDTEALSDWDSGLLIFVHALVSFCNEKEIAVDLTGLPEGARRLLTLATAVPERKDVRRTAPDSLFLHRVADEAMKFWEGCREMLEFMGEAFIAFSRLLAGKASFRVSDLVLVMQQCGAQALPIVTLISVLVGLIFAFVGSIQLRMFGAQVYVASLVAIAMVRIMGAIMTGIIMAGRTGASFAAQLGTMQTNEEIDAMKTFGISPMEFLVMPRVIGLSLMMPLLCIYADFMGILGGLMIGVFMLDIGPVTYYNYTIMYLNLTHFWVGIVHSFVFGILVALAGCLRGMQCDRSAAAVGMATTSAVVTGITSIIVATAIITVICDILGI